MLGLGGFAGAISAIVFGRLSDKVNPKAILLLCLVVGGISYFPQGLAPAIVMLIAFRLLFGLTTGVSARRRTRSSRRSRPPRSVARSTASSRPRPRRAD